jgi:hypothetical protein
MTEEKISGKIFPRKCTPIVMPLRYSAGERARAEPPKPEDKKQAPETAGERSVSCSEPMAAFIKATRGQSLGTSQSVPRRRILPDHSGRHATFLSGRGRLAG